MYQHFTSSLSYHLKRNIRFPASLQHCWWVVQKLMLNNKRKKNDCKAGWWPWHHCHPFRGRVNKFASDWKLLLQLEDSATVMIGCQQLQVYNRINQFFANADSFKVGNIATINSSIYLCCDVKFKEAFVADLISGIGNAYNKWLL